MPVEINSTQNPRIKSALRLHSSRGRKLQSRMIVFGRRELTRASQAGIGWEEIYLDQSLSEADRLAVLGECEVNQVFLTSPAVMEKLQYGQRGDGVVGIASRPVTDLDRFPVPSGACCLAVLERLEKPGNVGAILRSVDASGAAGVLLADPLTDPFHPNSIRASTGVVFSLPIACGTTIAVHQWLADHQFQVMTATLESGSSDFYESDCRGKIAIAVGNEATGLSPIWHQPTNHSVKLPMRGVADSLNVSATAAVMLYEVMRQQTYRSG